MTLEQFAVTHLIGFFVVFARLGTAFMFMPGVGEKSVPARIRLVLSLVVCFALYSATPAAKGVPTDLPSVVGLLCVEVTIGVWIGMTCRIMMAGLQFAGFQIGQVSSLANAFAPNTNEFQGATLVSSFLMMLGIMLIFVSDAHVLIVEALVQSYNVMPMGVLFVEDMAMQIAKVLGWSMKMGLVMAAPFFVMGILNNVGLGLANRMMPTLPVFFVAAPILIVSGIVVLYYHLPTAMDYWLDGFVQWIVHWEVFE